MEKVSRRYETDEDYQRRRPIHAVWEITLACNLRCSHCGSRAGKRRSGELSTQECLDVVAQLARLGVRQVSLIGGEAYLRSDWLDIVRAVTDYGMDCSMQTGGRGLTEAMVRDAVAAGLKSCGVSIDGLPALHDRLRGTIGAYKQAMEALAHLHRYGVPSSVNTQIGPEVVPQLRALMHRIVEGGAKNWQIQLTVPMGNAADRPELLLQPYELLDLMPLLAEIHGEALDLGLFMQPSNNIGYFGPYEHIFRVIEDTKGHWQGCAAGQTAIGIEADGTIKGCPSLPTESYAGGNIRDLSIAQIWEMADTVRYTQDRDIDDLWGFCRSCYYADVCRAGCTWMSHVLVGRPGNNPYCHYRALQLAKRGLRERLIKVGKAPGRPFDHGQFEMITEALDGGEGPRIAAVPPPPRDRAGRPRRSEGCVPPVLKLCHGCKQYVLPGTTTCPHCGGDVAALDSRYTANLADAQAAAERLRRLLESARRTPDPERE
ncbi:GDL motif peptide-associated radical SAM/SPASM maturase [Sorangium sp. So ce1000]|uniref:GDL motif peptide-associated radical SAM/SPASM maturase n=1 Tax=Sorangium sp. So ce1000 TaxID=3133325 RepID=UPI003F62328C